MISTFSKYHFSFCFQLLFNSLKKTLYTYYLLGNENKHIVCIYISTIVTI